MKINESKLAPIIDKVFEKMNTRSDYEIVCVQEDKIFLVDLDLGNRSVTNDAERVWLEINRNFPGKRIIYRDTLGMWDEIILGKKSYFVVDVVFFVDVDYIHYTEEVPDFSLTGCPSSELLRT